MKKLEKLISNLSKHWGISPEAVVDRLNDMDKSELNKIVNQMTKKFQNGGLIDCLQKGGKYSECKKCGGKVIEKVQNGKPDLGGYMLQKPNGTSYRLEGYNSLNPQKTVESITNPSKTNTITRTIAYGDTSFTHNGQPYDSINLDRINQIFDKHKEEAILQKKGQEYLDFRKRTSFNDGGKMVEKAQSGGITRGNWRDYHTIINAPGDTLRFKQYFSGPAYMQTHPEGGVTYERSTRDGVARMYDEDYKPSWWELNVLGYQPVTVEEKENWKQLIYNHRNDPAVKDKTQKRQGGKL